MLHRSAKLNPVDELLGMHFQVKDREAYYIDLQLLRVTKKLQAVLKGDRGEKDKELVQKTEARVEMMERSHESKVMRVRKVSHIRVSNFRVDGPPGGLAMCQVNPEKQSLRAIVAELVQAMLVCLEGHGLNKCTYATCSR